MAGKPENVMEIREELLVPSKGGKPTKKTAHFIKPILNSSEKNPELPTNPLPLRPTSLNCSFYGWRTPTDQWNSWVDRLHSSFKFIWKTAGIYEAILSSKYKIVRNEDLFFGLAERWCCETNTFVFPWGEATVTLEDVAVLGGYSVLGDSVSGGINSNGFTAIEKKLINHFTEISTDSSQKVLQCTWMKHFMSLGGDSGVEHEAFLSLWLSRFVLPTYPYDVVLKSYFKIGICLARGVAIALAPVVLASIYRDLSLLKSSISTSNGSGSGLNGTDRDGFDDLVLVTLWGPVQLVQVWAWERFPEFRPKPNLIECGEPRLARWHDVNEDDIGNVRPMLQSAGHSFEWRPYSKDVENLALPMFYRDSDQWVVVGDRLGDDIKSLVRFLRVCELVGMDTIEQYNPNRVAMQFGFDQDVPQIVKRDLVNSDIPKREFVQLAWLNYFNSIKDEILHIPSRFNEPQVTLRYLKWIRRGVLARHAAFDDGLAMRKKRSCIKRPRRLYGSSNNAVEDPDSIVAQDIAVKRLSGNLNNAVEAPDSIVAQDIDVKPMIQTEFTDDHLQVPPGYMPTDANYHLDVPSGFTPMYVGNILDYPPGFPPKFNIGNMAAVPPGFPPKSNADGHVARTINVPSGFTPMYVGNILDYPPGFPPKFIIENMADVPPGFPPKSNVNGHVARTIDMAPGSVPNHTRKFPAFPTWFLPIPSEGPTPRSSDQRDEQVMTEPRVNIKKEPVNSIVQERPPMLMCGYQTTPTTENGFREGLFRTEENSVKTEPLKLDFNPEGERLNNGNTAQPTPQGSSDLEARIRHLESMVAELTQPR